MILGVAVLLAIRRTILMVLEFHHHILMFEISLLEQKPIHRSKYIALLPSMARILGGLIIAA